MDDIPKDVELSANGTKTDINRSLTQKKSLISILKSLGPGLVTGASDDDPSGIATYSQAGAQFGFGM